MDQNYDRMMTAQQARNAPPKEEPGQLQMAQLMQQMMESMERLQAAPAIAPAAPAVPVNDQANANHGQVKLPKYDIPKFSGDIMEWSGFWSEFSSAVHNVATIPAVTKFNYLRSHVVGDAFKSIAEFQNTAENYQEAVDILTGRYGRNDLIISSHYSKLQNMPPTTTNSAKLQSFYDDIELTFRALTTLDQNVDNMALIATIKSKLPQDVLRSMETFKPPADAWNMAQVRQYLKQDLEIRETSVQSEKIFTATAGSRDPSEFSGSGARPKTTYHSSSSSTDKYKSHSSAGALVANTHNQTSYKGTCVYCKRGHWSDECRTVPTLEARKKKLIELCLCFKCLRGGHSTKDSRSQRQRFYCKEPNANNNWSICPQPKLKSKPSSEKSVSYLSTTGKKDDEPTGDKKEVLGLTSMAQQSHDSDVSVIMLTAMATVENPENSNLVEQTHLTFDTGADKTWVSTEFADKLDLPQGKPIQKSVAIFASTGVTDILRHIHRFCQSNL